jgi:hypothetical protein
MIPILKALHDSYEVHLALLWKHDASWFVLSSASGFASIVLGLAAAVTITRRRSRRTNQRTNSYFVAPQESIAVHGGVLLPSVDPCCQDVYFVKDELAASAECDSQTKLAKQRMSQRQAEADLLAASYSNFSVVELTFATDRILDEMLSKQTQMPNELKNCPRAVTLHPNSSGTTPSSSKQSCAVPFAPNQMCGRQHLKPDSSSSDAESFLTNADSLRTVSWTPPPQNPIVVTNGANVLYDKANSFQKNEQGDCKAMAKNTSNISDVSSGTANATSSENSILTAFSQQLIQIALSSTSSGSKFLGTKLWVTQRLVSDVLAVFQKSSKFEKLEGTLRV